MKPGTKLHIVSIMAKVANIVVTLMGIICVMQAAYGLGMVSEFDRVLALIIGVWILSMATFDKRLKSIDESLTMIAMTGVTKDIVNIVDKAHSKMKEIQKHGTKTGNSAEAAQETDSFDTTAKTGAHD
jgi:hypothetical protein